MQAAIGQLAVFSLTALGFISALVGIIAFLSILRRVRLKRAPQQVTASLLPTPAQRARDVLKMDVSAGIAARQLDIHSESQVEPSPPKPATLPEEWQMPARAGSPDQVVILIEPDTGPSAQEQLIQKLIEYLEKQEQEIRAG